MKIMTEILVPIGGTLNMKYYCDDKCDIYIDDVLCVHKTSHGGGTFTISMTSNTYYTVYIEFSQDGYDFEYSLSWLYPSNAYNKVPMSNIFLPKLIGSSPYNINVSPSV